MLTRAPLRAVRIEPPPVADAPPDRPAKAQSATPEMQLLWAAMLFNLVLCFIDTNLFRLSPLPVMAAEAAILAGAFFLPFTRPGRSPGRFDGLLVLMVISWLLFAMLRQQVDPKYLRDVAIMPVFVLLGLYSRDEGFHPRLFWLHMVIVAVAIWEAIDVQGFVRVISIADYFAHTRGSDSQDWWVDSGLYISAVRPEARFLFPNLPLHRLSSVFLEPVSLGNYVVIATIWLAGWWRRIPRAMAWVAAIGTFLLLVGSDSRMATVACLAILAALPVKRFIPGLAPVLVAPVVIAAMVLAVVLLGLETGLDTFGGRIAHSVALFRDFTLANWAGLSLDQLKAAEDAGFGYLIMVYSLPVAAAIWILLFRRRLRTADSRYLHLAIALYVALNLTVSWSIFSVKTAALLWFMLGRSIREDGEAVVDEGAGVTRPRQRWSARSAT